MNRVVLLLAAALVGLPLALASAQDADRPAALRGVEFIRAAQQSDGGFGNFGQTTDAVFAIRAAGLDPTGFRKDGRSPADYLAESAPAISVTPGLAAKGALAAAALGLDPRAVGGVDLLAAIASAYDPATGNYGEDAFSQSIAMIGLACSGVAVPNRAVLALAAAQLEDGGWGFGESDADTTAIAIQALLLAGIPRSDARVEDGSHYLGLSQNDDGGWGFGGESNTSSTAFAMQGLIAAGRNPLSDMYLKSGRGPRDYLLANQDADGAFAGFDRLFATNQVIPALMGRTFCEAPSAPVLALPPRVVPLPPATGSGVAGGEHPGAQLVLLSLLILLGGGALAGMGVRLSRR